mgnify:CR=1 FL=1
MSAKPQKMQSATGEPAQANAQALNTNAQGSAAGQGQNMSVTLGSQNRASSSQDAVMEGNDPLTSAARNDGPRQSLSGQNASGQVVEALEVNGEVPQARFGHTITIVSKSKVVLFGGATGDTGKYSMTGETFMYNILNKAWQKLQGKWVGPVGSRSPAV